MDETQETLHAYEQIAEKYADRWATNDAVVEHARGRFLANLPTQPALVDVGCGPGRDLGLLAERAPSVVGVDLSFAMIAEARKRFDGPLLVADMRSLPFQRESFDGAWVCASLLHVPKRDAPRTLTALRTLLTSDGILFVGVKEGRGESFRARDGVRRFFSFYSEAEIAGQITDAGFAVKECWIERDEVHPDPWINVIAKAR